MGIILLMLTAMEAQYIDIDNCLTAIDVSWAYAFALS